MPTRTSEFISRRVASYVLPSKAPAKRPQASAKSRRRSASKRLVAPGASAAGHPKFDARSTLVDKVAAHLREMILKGTMAPGTRLNELRLAEGLSLSRSPLREAFRMLAAEGLVVITPRRGAWVRPISISELRDVFETRALFELFAVTRAQQRNEVELSHMRGLLHDAQAMLKRGDIAAWYESSQAFHDALVDAAGNGQLKALYELLKPSMRRYQLMVIGLPRHPDGSQAEHQQIFDAFVRGDTQRACNVLRDHLGRVASTLTAALKKGRTEAELRGQVRRVDPVATRASGGRPKNG